MKVLVVGEGPTDEYMLRPIVQAMLKTMGKVQANVRFSPVSKRKQGIRDVLTWNYLEAIIIANPMVDVFLLCVDRDGLAGRKQQLTILEREGKKVLTVGQTFLAENAWQEIEVWLLAGQKDLPGEWRWQDVRQEPSAKERYFEPYARQRELLSESPGGGRMTIASAAAANYPRIRQLCPELADLEQRITTWLSSQP